jgi:hypothetical protein
MKNFQSNILGLKIVVDEECLVQVVALQQTVFGPFCGLKFESLLGSISQKLLFRCLPLVKSL